jgi:hypothetical protein
MAEKPKGLTGGAVFFIIVGVIVVIHLLSISNGSYDYGPEMCVESRGSYAC